MSDDRRARLHDLSTRLPEIDQILPEVIEAHPGARLLMRGRNLDGVTSVEVGGRKAHLRSAGSTSLLVDLPPGLAAGIQPVQAFLDVPLDDPPASHRLCASKPASFVLRPRLVRPPQLGEGHELVAVVEPPVASGQRVTLLLNPIDGDGTQPPASYSLPAVSPATGSSLRFDLQTVNAGNYLVRLEVGGVRTALKVDDDPASPTFDHYVAPRITVP